MTSIEREKALHAVESAGEMFRLAPDDEPFVRAMEEASRKNTWFTRDNVLYAARQWGEALTGPNLAQWVGKYPLATQKKDILLVLAGNIPLVGLHDILCTYLSGHRATIKPSKDDTVLISFVTDFLREAEPSLADNLRISQDIVRQGVDAVVATGSDNTERYFEYYFRDIPALLRHSRYSIGVVGENTTDEELSRLTDDMMLYFGMGCRSVSKIFIPEDFDLDRLTRALRKYAGVMDHTKYRNNYDYRRAMFAMAGLEGIHDTGLLLLTPQEGLAAPLGVAGYQRYSDIKDVQLYIDRHRDELQCVTGEGHLPFGRAQNPSLEDYADGKDTMEFLLLKD